jgi:hypothetical protein
MIIHDSHCPQKQRNAMTRRAGYTVVELLVAAAVSIALMVIITGAFQQGIDMFRRLRAQGNMQERLRIASIIMRDDLTAWHFTQGQGQYLYQQDLNLVFPYTPPGNPGWSPPADGFFRIYQAPENPNDPNPVTQGNPFVLEGSDSDGINFTRATRHALHFTVQRRGAGPENNFRVLNPPPSPPSPVLYTPIAPNWMYPPDYRDTASFSSQWAEVIYYLATNGESANGTPLYTLYRRQKLLAPNNVNVPNTEVMPQPPDLQHVNPEISSRVQLTTQLGSPAGLYYNRAGRPALPPNSPTPPFAAPFSVTQPRYRFGMGPADDNLAGANVIYLAGLFNPAFGGTNYPHLMTETADKSVWTNDVLLSDVISFEIKVSWDPPIIQATGQPDPNYLPVGSPGALQQTYFVPDSTQPTGVRAVPNTDLPFDFLPLSTRNQVLAAQKLRVFDTWSQESVYGQVLVPGGPPLWRRIDLTGAQSAPCLPCPIKINALQIRFRIWDNKTNQTRQVTIIQDA